MDSVALRPRSASEIVDAAFQILKAHYAQFVMCSAIAYAPWLLVQLVIASDPSVTARAGIGLSMLLGVGVWLVFALMSAVIIVCASQAYLGDPVDVGAAVRTALPRVPYVMLGALARYASMAVGLLFFIVGALYVGARFFAVTPVIVLEGEGVGRAFSRSTFLSDGRKRHVLNTLGLVAVIYWVIGIGVQIGAVMVGSLMLQAIVSGVYTILVYPVIAITEALLYYDTRIKSEGLDIELMAGALEPATPREPAAG
jgi:hypothetical protein